MCFLPMEIQGGKLGYGPNISFPVKFTNYETESKKTELWWTTSLGELRVGFPLDFSHGAPEAIGGGGGSLSVRLEDHFLVLLPTYYAKLD